MPQTKNHQPSITFGLKDFGPKERYEFGQQVRLAMGCMQRPAERFNSGEKPVNSCNAIPKDKASIRQRLKALSQDISSQHADLLELLVRFDDMEGWKNNGASHCAAWMNYEIGISIQLSWEYLRVGRKLQSLPTLKALFRVGSLSWSKVRLITRVATEETEQLLCHAALDASVSDVERICKDYHWKDDQTASENLEDNEQALKQWNSRSLTWKNTSLGSTCIQLVLPPETAQAFLNSVEHSLSQFDDADSKTENTMAQRRADAAVSMAESSLQYAGKSIATADRYQVIVSVDSTELSTPTELATPTDLTTSNESMLTSNNTKIKTTIPTKRATIRHAGPIANETARRVSCDCSIVTSTKHDGEPVSIGRKSRIWPTAMERAIKERDQHCVWPGCTHTRHLHIHHIKHWADGGETSIENGACLCSHHHTLVHEGGYSVQVVNEIASAAHEQFKQQRNQDKTLFDFEAKLRSSEESFNLVRKLSPSRYRFRIVNKTGKAILDNGPNAVAKNNSRSKLDESFAIKTHKHKFLKCSESAGDYTCVYNGHVQTRDNTDNDHSHLDYTRVGHIPIETREPQRPYRRM